MTRVIIMVLLAPAAFTASGQEPSVVAPQAYEKQFENDWVRVTRVHYESFEKLPEHRHPDAPTIFVYLNDGGPVLFKHEHGDAGTYAATRPPTKAGGFRIWKTSLETHVVENTSEQPSDFLQIELKTDIDPATFRGRFPRDPDRSAEALRHVNHTPGSVARPFRAAKGEAAQTSKVEFDNVDVRVSRVFCKASSECQVPQPSRDPALAIALSSSESPKVEVGQTIWLAPESQGTWRHHGNAEGEHLIVQIKHGPGATSGRSR